MYCESCGTKLPTNAGFCPSCGAAVKDVTATEHTRGRDVGEEHNKTAFYRQAKGSGSNRSDDNLIDWMETNEEAEVLQKRITRRILAIAIPLIGGFVIWTALEGLSLGSVAAGLIIGPVLWIAYFFGRLVYKFSSILGPIIGGIIAVIVGVAAVIAASNLLNRIPSALEMPVVFVYCICWYAWYGRAMVLDYRQLKNVNTHLSESRKARKARIAADDYADDQ